MARGKQANAIVLLTSATPCLESYYNALQNKFTLLKLTKRYGKSNYPAVELVDMKKEYSDVIDFSKVNIIIKDLLN